MKKQLLISLLIGAMPLGMAAQDDDLYFVSKKKGAEKVADNYGLPRETYYSGSDRSVDEYNRRGSYYEQIDSTMTDVIDFNGEKGVYPDSLAGEDYKLTKKLSRFDGYDISTNEAFWAGYRAGRDDWAWSSPWYYSRYGWYDPWYDPYWRYGWYDPWYDPWYYGYTGWYGPGLSRWAYRYHYWGYPRYTTVYYVGGRHYGYGHTGSMHRGNMNGRVYGSSGSSRVGRVGSSRLGGLANRSVGGHSSYSRGSGSRSVGTHRSYDRSSSSYSRSSSSSSYSRGSSVSRSSSFGGGGSFGGGSRGGGGFSGGGGGRSGGGHVGGRR